MVGAARLDHHGDLEQIGIAPLPMRSLVHR
jgi:hypothetical protein